VGLSLWRPLVAFYGFARFSINSEGDKLVHCGHLASASHSDSMPSCDRADSRRDELLEKWCLWAGIRRLAVRSRWPHGECQRQLGDVVFGNIGASGTKSAVVPAADGKGHLTLYCMESPECWFEDFRSAALAGGRAEVRIDAEFAQTIYTDEYYVFLEAEGDTHGLYVTGKTTTGFEVREAGGGRSRVKFSYRIVGKRRDVEAPRLKRATMPASTALTEPQ
jgi:hypothetical protein